MMDGRGCKSDSSAETRKMGRLRVMSRNRFVKDRARCSCSKGKLVGKSERIWVGLEGDFLGENR